MIWSERAGDNVIFHVGSKLFVVFWNTIHLMGWVVWVKQNIEETMESPSPDETDVADRHSGITIPWTWFPERVSIGRVLD